jgi:hypothetical protein
MEAMGKQRRGKGVRDRAQRESESPVEIRVAICVPGGEWDNATGFSLCETIAHFYEQPIRNPRRVKTFCIEGSILQDVRNLLIKNALKWNPTHLLLVDSDMNLPRDTLAKLLARSEACVGLNYVQRVFPTKPNTFTEGKGRVFTKPDSAGLEPVDHMGLGCVLVDARVFECIEAPAFEFETIKTYDADGHVTDWHTRGEDVYFFGKLRAAGIQPYVDHDLSKAVGHVGNFEFRHEHCEEALTGYKGV